MKKRTVVIGCGVIGNACARELAKHSQHEVFVLERNKSFGLETSSRNSEVIHAGIYYPNNSLKAKLCIQGRSLLYDYLNDHGIGYNKCGKLLIACNQYDEVKLNQLHQKAIANGVTNLIELSSADVENIEPEVYCSKALFSPDTGIFNSHQYQESLQVDAESSGASYVFNCEVHSVKYDNTISSHKMNSNNSNNINYRFKVDTSQGVIECDNVINAAGLYSIPIANRITCLNTALKLPYTTIPPPDSYYAKGNYFKIAGSKSPFHHLIYPVPAESNNTVVGLGIHATLDLQGYVRFGPDVEWLESPVTTTVVEEDATGIKTLKCNNVDNQSEAAVSLATLNHHHHHNGRDDDENKKYRFPSDFDILHSTCSNNSPTITTTTTTVTINTSKKSVYDVDETRKDSFIRAIETYWPGIKNVELIPDYSGIRPKLQGPYPTVPKSTTTSISTINQSSIPSDLLESALSIVRKQRKNLTDFQIEDYHYHGMKGLINLYGIESPGLTASLAIAKSVATMLSQE